MEYAALTIVWWALLRLLLRLILMPFNLTFAVREHFHRIKSGERSKSAAERYRYYESGDHQ